MPHLHHTPRTPARHPLAFSAGMTSELSVPTIGRGHLVREWNSPVRLQIGRGQPELVHGLAEALELLEHRWPSTEGRHRRNAIYDCAAALSRSISLAKARESFVAASIEAGMLFR